MPKPNILFIMTDEHRCDYVGYMNLHPALHTPNLDRLAREGVIFTHCFSPNPLCMPARCSIHTGLYSFQSGQMNNIGDWPMYLPTFTQALQKLGYHTALTGKLHAHEAVGYDIDLTDKQWDDEIHALGFDDVVQVAGKTMDFFTDDFYTHYLQAHGLLYVYREDIVKRTEVGGVNSAWPSVLPEEHYIDNYIGRQAVKWFESYRGDRPFFHMVSFCSPHPCYDAYKRVLDQVDRDKVILPFGSANPERYREMVANYIAQIQIVDENVGRIIQVLEARGWLDNTLILFTADHGEMLGDMDRFGKCFWEDASTRVPMFVRFKPWTGPRVVEDTIVSIHDVAATFIDLAAGEDLSQKYLPGCSSVSLKPFLTGVTNHVRDVAFSENGGQFYPPWRMIDNGVYKYVWLNATGEELLFDKRSDPYCLKNIAAEPASANVIHQMRREMLRIYVAYPAPKAGRAGYSPLVPHRITRERLLKYKI